MHCFVPTGSCGGTENDAPLYDPLDDHLLEIFFWNEKQCDDNDTISELFYVDKDVISGLLITIVAFIAPFIILAIES